MDSWSASSVLCAAPATAADRDKTDVIVLKNGDRVTGEITGTRVRSLRLSTDDMGTINIEWAAIASIDSQYTFDVERGGRAPLCRCHRHSEDGQDLVIRDEGMEEDPSRYSIVRVTELEQGFWQRISGSLSVGFNYTKATGIRTASVNISSQYQAEATQGHARHQRTRNVEPRHRAERAREHFFDAAIPTRAAVFSVAVELARAQRRARHRCASDDRRRN